MASDPLDDVLDLEERFYQEGYQQGFQDGERAGLLEGRSFGMLKGYEKFLESGRLASKAIVWASRLPQSSSNCTLPPLSENTRLQKNINTLYALVEPETLSTGNTDEAVQDFDDRVKRALGKAKIVERMAGGSAAKDGPRDGASKSP